MPDMATSALAKAGQLVVRPLGAIAAGLTRLQNNLYQPPNTTIDGVSDSNFVTALQPVRPFGGDNQKPLGMNIQMGQNLIFTPRPDARYTTPELQMYSMYPLARICIEMVKNIVADMPWKIQLKNQPGESKKERETKQLKDDTIQKLTEFIARPNAEMDFKTFTRRILEDMLVCDAGSIFLRYDPKGVVYEWRPFEGAYITRLITDQGYTPEPPNPAFQQLWEGMPLVDMTTDQLIYRPRNICYRVGTISYSLYGIAPTEYLAPEIEVGIQRLQYVTSFYKNGSVPNVLWVVPPEAHPDKVQEGMTFLNSKLAGNLEARRQIQFAQGYAPDGKDAIHQFKEPELADNYDDLHIRKIAAGYGVSAQRLLKTQNRATAQSNQEAAEEEGIAPYLGWYAGVVNEILQVKMGYDKYEFVYDTSRDPDPGKQSDMDKQDVAGGVETINGARLRRGWDTVSDPAADQLAITTPQGRVPIGQPVLPKPAPGGTTPQNPAPTGNVPPKPNPAPSKVAKVRTETYKYGTVQINIPTDSEAGNAILEFGKSIGKDQLAGDGREEEPHITVRYGVKGDSDIAGIVSYLSSLERFDITFGLTDSFEPSEHSDGAAPLFVTIDAEVLGKINDELDEHGEFKPSDFDYHPHATIAYVDPDHVKDFTGNAFLAGKTFTVESINVNPKDGSAVTVPLKGTKKYRKVNKAFNLAVIDPSRDSIRTRSATAKVQATFANFFHNITNHMVIVSKPVHKVRKAKNKPEDEQQIDEIVDAIMTSIDWNVLPTAVEDALQDAGLEGVSVGLDQVERMEQVASGQPITLSAQPVRVVAQALISETNRVAMDYAKDRSAELVGMKWVDGELIENPNAKWAITDSTRNMLRDIITKSFESDTPLNEIVQRIKDAGVFSDERAKMIAQTEIKMAQVGGNYASWQKSGLVKTVRSLLSADHKGLDECDENAEAGPIPFGTNFPSGQSHSPFHVRCQCSIQAVEIGGLSRKW